MVNLFFENFSFIIILISILVFSFAVLLYRKKISNIYNSKVLFASVFLFFLYWIPQGFDITDEGFALTKSWFILHGGWHQNIDMTWGSSLLNGLWLSVFPAPNLFWARIGFALITALNSLIVFQIVKQFFSIKISFLTVLGLSILIPFGNPQTVNYQNLPVLFILLSFYFFIKGNKKNKYGYIVLSGFLIFTTVMLKFPFIVFLFYPFIYYFAEYIFYKKPFNNQIKFSLYNLFGIIGGILFFIFILLIFDGLHDYVTAVISKFQNTDADTTHSLNNLLAVYKNDLILILKRTVLLSAFVFVMTYFYNYFKNKILKAAYVFLTSFILILFAFKIHTYFNWIYLIFGFELSALIMFLIFYRNNMKNIFLLLFFAVFLFFFSFVGSDIGFRLHIWSGSEIFFGTVFLLMYHKKFELKFIKLNFKFLLPSFFIFLFILSIIIKPDYIYRDQNRKQLTYTFKINGLEGIKTTKERIEVTDSLLHFIKKEINDKNKLFVAGTMPMFYFLTENKPVLKNLWIQDKSDFKEYLKGNNIPEYFLFPLKNSRNIAWPIKTSVLRKSDSINLSYYKNFVVSGRYKKVYKNSMFELFKRQEKY